jgi:hypothetical protein
MINRLKKYLFVLLLVAISCGIEVGNPEKEGASDYSSPTTQGNTPLDHSNIILKIQATRPAAFSQSPSTIIPVIDHMGLRIGEIILTEANIAITEVLFYPVTGVSIPISLVNKEIRSPYAGVTNILSGVTFGVNLDSTGAVATPDTTNSAVYGGLSLKNGSYKNIALSTSAAYINTLNLQGTYTGKLQANDVFEMPFSFSYPLMETFPLSILNGISTGFDIQANKLNTLIIAFRLNKWFRFDQTQTNPNAINFLNVESEKNSDGVEIINLDANSINHNLLIQMVILNNIQYSADYGIDLNNDGNLAIEEDDDPNENDADDL